MKLAVVVAAAGAVLLSGCTVQGHALYPSADKIAADVQQWRQDMSPDLLDLKNSMTVVGDDALVYNVSKMKSDCAGWEQSLNIASKWAVSPRADVTREMYGMFDAWKQSATICQSLDSVKDVSDMTAFLKTGTEHVDEIMRLIGVNVLGV